MTDQIVCDNQKVRDGLQGCISMTYCDCIVSSVQSEDTTDPRDIKNAVTRAFEQYCAQVDKHLSSKHHTISIS